MNHYRTVLNPVFSFLPKINSQFHLLLKRMAQSENH